MNVRDELKKTTNQFRVMKTSCQEAIKDIQDKIFQMKQRGISDINVIEKDLNELMQNIETNWTYETSDT